ncbi:TPA: hypothetical protein JF904_002929 [Legionella pneumophila]|uniref:Uncharacterized protein n=1 Tax=Legionella pneumophila TaxID=446 RepID=A0AAP3HBZ1_LEGPN|nr:hypothetical protein [Legionella pneumophila]HAT9433914.1 hypothetical protein [Legionella pneumophila subsp. pneumophila]MCZ4691557.1 hypothetical protein [Legionella pneumophila]MCZ4711073.1 hypothetical protein [Legionella pneumophila]MCZ4718691.1 hypothetical protein [Legionella pneumophila]MDW9186452.1 hypothetical protein [Legionella pneumophila]
MRKYKLVTEKILTEIQQSGRPFILEHEGDEVIPKLWLFHDVNTLSYILVMRSYNDDKNGRRFNHIVIDDSLSNSTIAENFDKVIKKIGDGNCFAWQSNGNFMLIDKCNMPHC